VSLRRTVILSATALFVSPLFSQTTPSFEVATIKPSGPKSVRGSNYGPGHPVPTRFAFSLASLMDSICIAYNVDRFQVSSSTPLDRQNFDVVASVPEDATRQQFRMMLQNLLAERFALKLHIDSKEFPAYELVVSKTGLKIGEAIALESPSPTTASSPRSPDDIGWPQLPPNLPGMAGRAVQRNGYLWIRLKAQTETFSRLAGMLKTPDETPIVDKTGLTGAYSFTLEYTRDAGGTAPTDPPPAPDLSTALQHQLGLQLVSKKLPFDVVVVESFNKLPTDN
jgi:uncharacterized protein (TIGR03435 family)